MLWLVSEKLPSLPRRNVHYFYIKFRARKRKKFVFPKTKRPLRAKANALRAALNPDSQEL